MIDFVQPFVLAAWLTSYQGATAVESILYAGKFLSLSLVLFSLFLSLSSLFPSLICLLPPSLLHFVHLHPLLVSSLLDSFPLFLLPPHSLSLIALPRPSLSTLSLPTLSYFLFISTPCMCPLCLILLYISLPPLCLSQIALPRPSVSTLSHFEVILSSPLLTIL